MKLSLLMDLYELTMAAGYLRHDMQEKPAVFDLYFRRHPFEGEYALFAGLDPALDYLARLRFDDEDLEYLGRLGLFDDRFLLYLQSFRFRGRVVAAAEGEVVFATEPVLSVEAALAEAQMVETALLNIINFQTLIATKASRIVQVAGEDAVVEFGARRAQGPDGALSATRAACVGGARVTSNLMAGQAYDIPVAGTQAHSWIMAFPGELEAFRAYAAAFPDHCVLLVDTYDTLTSGLPNAITVGRELRAGGHQLRGVRLDSGDLALLSREARRMLDEAGLPDVMVLASNELDEHVIAAARRDGARIDRYGVGTRLATGAGEGGGALGGIYKLVELDGKPRMKVSSDRLKSTLPGRKRLWRATAPGGTFVLDLIAGHDERPEPGGAAHEAAPGGGSLRLPTGAALEDLRTVVMEGGRRLHPPRPLAAIADHAQQRLACLDAGCRRLESPEPYPVVVSDAIETERRRVLGETAS